MSIDFKTSTSASEALDAGLSEFYAARKQVSEVRAEITRHESDLETLSKDTTTDISALRSKSRKIRNAIEDLKFEAEALTNRLPALAANLDDLAKAAETEDRRNGHAYDDVRREQAAKLREHPMLRQGVELLKAALYLSDNRSRTLEALGLDDLDSRSFHDEAVTAGVDIEKPLPATSSIATAENIVDKSRKPNMAYMNGREKQQWWQAA